MKKISVVLIDDHDDYRWSTKNFLTTNGILVKRSFTHNEFLKQTKLEDEPDIFIIPFDIPKFLTGLTIGYVREHYPLVKLLINSSIRNQKAIGKILGMGVDGLIFKNREGPQNMLKALNCLRENGKYFVGIK